MECAEELNMVMEAVGELQDDATLPRNIKIKLDIISEILHKETELSLKVNKALDELDSISDDTNIQPYTRTQIWNIVSMLETL
ncbi:UPF0147 family protein [Candidatus Woesearchaeota archaeon]|nr:UPF0147 family protein [Candidatus Woesearchaeota archaeon]